MFQICSTCNGSGGISIDTENGPDNDMCPNCNGKGTCD